MKGKDGRMPRVTKLNEPAPLALGWLVKAGSGYYTGNVRSAFECWTVFPQFAKVYQRKRWAQTMADRLGGQVVPALAARHKKASHP